MSVSKAAYAAEQAIGHDSNSIIQQDVTNYAGERGDPSHTMKALVWKGKNKVQIGTFQAVPRVGPLCP